VVKVLVVSQAEVPRLLPMGDCIEAMGDALAALARGDAVLPLRQVVRLPDGRGLLASMPAVAGHVGAMGLKAITVFPGNHGTELDAHQGAVLLFEADRGRLLAVIDATSVTAIRTAAVSGLATRLLAREDAGDLAILGTGVQARTHLEAMGVVRRLRRVRVWSRTRANAEAFAREEAAPAGIAIEVAATVEEAVRGADLVCTTTAAKEPVLRGAWLAPGAHVNAVGACFPSTRELDTEAVRRARVFTDCRESCLNEAGDFRIARDEGAFTDTHLLGEIGEVFVGRVPGRIAPGDVTVDESLGIALEDLAAAHFIHRRAGETGAGTWLEWGGPPS
jgi:ornithine cyclodeaminase